MDHDEAKLFVHYLPGLCVPQELEDDTVVVIDVLRATTTIVWALAAGAQQIIPVLEVDEARALASRFPDALLGGERLGRRIDQFDFGNSPAEYTADRVAQRTIIFTTTNGTRALKSCALARHIWIASFANLSAVCRRFSLSPGRWHLVCAGTDGQVTREDVLCAGAIVDRLSVSSKVSVANDQARIARDAWQAAQGRGDLASELAHTHGGENLRQLGYADDVERAAIVDAYDLVPEFDRDSHTIRIAPCN